jgi:hypothetical protein
MGGALLGRKQRQESGQGIDREALPRREIQHLALKFERVAGLGATIDGGTFRSDDLHPKVVEFKGVIRHGTASVACCGVALS